MAIDLPLLPRTATISPRLMDFGGTLTPPLGGPVQRISRLGARFAVDVSLPPLSLADARAFLAALLAHKTSGTPLRLNWPQAGPPLALGTPLVNGAGQTGATIAADGFTAGVTVPAGTFFSFLAANGRIYLHMTTATVVATGGAAVLPIAPMLRTSPADNGALGYNPARIEGLLPDGDVAWSIEMLRGHGLTFSLAEAR